MGLRYISLFSTVFIASYREKNIKACIFFALGANLELVFFKGRIRIFSRVGSCYVQPASGTMDFCVQVRLLGVEIKTVQLEKSSLQERNILYGKNAQKNGVAVFKSFECLFSSTIILFFLR